VSRYTAQEAADRAGVSADYFGSLVAAGVVGPDADGSFSESDARRAASVLALTEAGVPLDRLVHGFAQGHASLDFLDDPVYARFASNSGETFEQVSARSGIPMSLLTSIRESIGLLPPQPTDRVRDQELVVAKFLEMSLEAGFTPEGLEPVLRVMGDSMRRIAETEAEAYYRTILAPRVEAGLEVGGDEPEWVSDLSRTTDEAIIAIYHGQQGRTWTNNIIRTVEGALAGAGIYETTERFPAICFLDITGYTRLTQERGDAEAASVAGELGRLVQRTSAQHGGSTIKWLGDGVMFYFPDPGSGVAAALEMVSVVASAELPPAHVGIHCGPVMFKEGDYFGQTVIMAARMGDFARPGEVLASAEIVNATSRPDVAFTEIGPVELKGVSGAVQLFTAHRP